MMRVEGTVKKRNVLLPLNANQLLACVKQSVATFQQIDIHQCQKDLVSLMRSYREGNEYDLSLDYFELLTATIHINIVFYQKDDGSYAYLNPNEVIRLEKNHWRTIIHLNTDIGSYHSFNQKELAFQIQKSLIHEFVHILQIINQDIYESEKDYMKRFCEREAETVALFYCQELLNKKTPFSN